MQKIDAHFSLTPIAAALTAGGATLFVVAWVTFHRYVVGEALGVAGISLVYIAIGLFALRSGIVPGVVAGWVFPVGLALAVLEITNILLEQFVGLPSPANAVVPASMMALMVLFASTSAVVGSVRHKLSRGVASAVVVIALGMLVSVAAVVIFAQFVAQPNPETFWRVMCENAVMHLTLPPVLALVVSLLAVTISKLAARHPFRLSVFISLAAFPLFFIGVVFLVHAASLPRAARPSFVLPGMAVSAFALICLPCFLGAEVSPGTA
jgi:hypothetical protein